MLFVLAFTLSMDAFAVSITNGIAMRQNKSAKIIIVGALSFGFAQGLMPVIGYFAGKVFADYITEIDHWIAFVLLSFIGIKMIYDSVQEMKSGGDETELVCTVKEMGNKTNPEVVCEISMKTIFLQAIATSIDALAVGVSLALLNVNIAYAAVLIGVITFVVCVIGGAIGSKVGGMFKDKATIVGGIVLIAIGLNILREHILLV